MTTTDANHYGVKIAKESGPGAANVGSLVLLPNGSAYYSSLLSGTTIDGSLLGPLTLQKSSGGTGGEGSITIWGNVEGDVSIPLASELVVYGSVAEDVTIELGDAGSVLIYGDLAGELSFPNGLAGGGKYIDINGTLAVTGVIDFEGEEFGGNLNLYGGAAAGSLVSAGDLTGSIRLGELYQDFAGTLSLDSITQTGTLGIEVAELTGMVDVQGDWAGGLDMYGNISEAATISIGGSLTDSGRIAVFGSSAYGRIEGVIEITGDAQGYITCWQDITGNITIGGDAGGYIKANVLGTLGGDISGNVTIDGTFNGNLCGENLSPMEALPDNISIGTFGSNGLICGARPGCVDGTIADSTPADGTHDARQPHPIDNCSLGARQGIGSTAEPIVITLSQGGANNLDCWSLCETGIEEVDTGAGCGTLSANAIASVTANDPDDGVYEIVLNRPISAGHWTTVTYLGDDSQVAYASLPADANASGTANVTDITALINYLNDVQTPPYGLYSEDINHSGTATSADITRLNDLLGGTSKFISWINKTLPTNSCAGESLMGGGEGESETEAVETMIEELVAYLIWVDPQLEEEWSAFMTTLSAVGECIASHVSEDAACELAGALTSEKTSFANSVVSAAAVEFAGGICP